GLEFQRDLADANVRLSIIFITGHADVPMTVRAMKAGAVEFLTKPFRGQELLDAIREAIAKDRAAWNERAQMTELRARYGSLTAREKEVLDLVVSGLLNKQIGAELGTSEFNHKDSLRPCHAKDGGRVPGQAGQDVRKTKASSGFMVSGLQTGVHPALVGRGYLYFVLEAVYLPGMSGFELQNHLNIERHAIPIIFITAHAYESSRQRALSHGLSE
ncbi:MAG TPA: response regulator, partial [Edaphobacter sp.]|nr:response regulator [Edaphobacter sp.]